jgi:hypothetical protein
VALYSREWYFEFVVMTSCCSGGYMSEIHLPWYGYKVEDYPVGHALCREVFVSLKRSY